MTDSKEEISAALKPGKQPSQGELERAAEEMLAHNNGMLESDEWQRLCPITIVDLNCREIHFKVSKKSPFV